ncbi:MAG: hypothetical protein WCF04_08320 [Candidatus Nanopelagicales bacterium]
MGRVVAGVAVGEAVGQRHRSVGADREDPHQLLQVGPVVLGVPVGDRDGGLSGTLRAVRVAVVAVQRHGCGVVVKSARVDVELADRAEHDRGQQAGPVGVEQRLQRPAHPVVVDHRHVSCGQPEQRRVVAGGPLAQDVERFPAQHQVRDHQPDRVRGGQLQPGVVVR